MSAELEIFRRNFLNADTWAFYLLPDFNDEKVNAMLNNFRDHQEYLVAQNAARALGLSTDEVVEKFRTASSAT